ncbi:MAG: hypothetical protein EOO05_03325 [Chitinophagaceae bacterium]|nr:MAG: hypothetical protein EOO05_03325 [Chitinophagaceae bacterium]
MVTDTNLQFIKEKISQIRTAIMYNMSNELVRLPNSVVESVNVDDQGHVWFVCKPPVQGIEHIEHHFPVRLHFYKKGTGCRLEVSGKATIITNEYTSYFASDENGVRPLLLKMDMLHVEYTEPQEKRKTKMELWLETGYKWFLRTASVQHQSKPDLSVLQVINHV